AEGYYGIALVHSRLGQVDVAVGEFQRSLALNEHDPFAHCELANALAIRGDLRTAAKHYAEAVKLRANYREALHNLGVMLKDLGDPGQAIKYLREAQRLSPDDPVVKASLEQAINASRQPRSK